MLPVVAVEVLLYLSRRNLDKMCAISKRLEALMALACPAYPLRPMRQASLAVVQREAYTDPDDENILWFDATIQDSNEMHVDRTFATLDEALAYLAPNYRHTYVDEFEVRLRLSDWDYRVSPRQWADLANIFRSGSARILDIEEVDLSILDDNAFVGAVRCRSLDFIYCGFRGILFSDDVLRSFAASGVLVMHMYANKCEEEYAVSEDAILDFCFPPSGPNRELYSDNLTTASDTFVVKFVERLLAPGCTRRPRGCLEFSSAKEQRGLAAYVQYLEPDRAKPTYRFPSFREEKYTYHFVIDYRNRDPANPTSRKDFHFGFGFRHVI